MDKILPCPFCGEKEKISIIEHSFHCWLVLCSTCGAEGPTSRSIQEESVEKWNSRVK